MHCGASSKINITGTSLQGCAAGTSWGRALSWGHCDSNTTGVDGETYRGGAGRSLGEDSGEWRELRECIK